MTIVRTMGATLLLLCGLGCNGEKNEPDLGEPDLGKIDSRPIQPPDATAAAEAKTPDRGKPDGAVAQGTRVLMKTTLGDITLELNEKLAPITVKNFLSYVDKKFYDGTIFHRVMSSFMIQGGGFDTSYVQKPTDPPIKNEADNGLSNLRGTIAMARTSVVDSATAQFFINVVDNLSLDHTSTSFGYAVFGKVTQGMDTVDKIKMVPTGNKTVGTTVMQNWPTTDVVIQSVTRAP